jgi:hypothetical protein
MHVVACLGHRIARIGVARLKTALVGGLFVFV